MGHVVIHSIIFYILVLILMRFMGKRQVGQLQPFELVVTIMISELAAIPIAEPEKSAWSGILPIIILAFFQLIFSLLTRYFPTARLLICGKPTLVINHGKILQKNLNKQLVSIEDILEQVRINGFLDIGDVEYAVYETNGNLSIFPKEDKRPLQPSDMNIQPTFKEFPVVLIVDGKLQKRNFDISGYDEPKLMKALKNQGCTRTQDVYFAYKNSDGKLTVVKKDKRGNKT